MPALLLPLCFVSLVFFSCFAYGSVAIPAFSLIEGGVFFITFLWCARKCCDPRASISSTGLVLPAVLLGVIVVCQLLPLPADLVRILSPQAAELYSSYIPASFVPSAFTLSVSADASMQEGLKLAAYFCLFFLVVNTLESKRDFDIVLNGIIITAAAASMLAVLQRYARADQFLGYHVDLQSSGPFANKNNFAGYLAMAVPLTLGYCFAQERIEKRILYGFAVGIMSAALFLTVSRGGFLVYFFNAAFFLGLLWRASFFQKRGMLVAAGGLVVACGWILSRYWQPIADRFMQTFSKDASFFIGHGVAWTDIMRIWGDFLLFGSGLGTFGALSTKYCGLSLQVTMTYAHNDCLQFLSEVGIAGIIPAFWFCLVYCTKVFSAWRGRHNGYVIATVAGTMTAVAGMGVYSFLDFNLHIPANAVLFVIIAGIGFKLVKVRWMHGE